MGATTFFTKVKGKTAREAFSIAKEQAYYEHGHSGYTGTIAEKSSFVMIAPPDGINPENYADDLMDNDDDRINDKWGPAGCIKLEGNEYLFFGWASE